MAITVNFKTQNGIVTSRQFAKNEGVSVYGKVTGVAGIGEPGTHVRMEILDNYNNSIFFKEDMSNIWGNYDFWFRTPPEDTKLKIVLIATYSIAGQDQVEIPIGIGSSFARPSPTPEVEGAWLSMLPVIAVGIGFAYLIKIMKE